MNAESCSLNFSQVLLFFCVDFTLHKSSSSELPNDNSLNRSIRLSLEWRIF